MQRERHVIMHKHGQNAMQELYTILQAKDSSLWKEVVLYE